MNVIMKKQTTLDGRPLRVGDPADVDKKTAQRWIEKGIAESAEKNAPSIPVTEGTEKPGLAQKVATPKEKKNGIKLKTTTSKKALTDVINSSEGRRKGE